MAPYWIALFFTATGPYGVYTSTAVLPEVAKLFFRWTAHSLLSWLRSQLLPVGGLYVETRIATALVVWSVVPLVKIGVLVMMFRSLVTTAFVRSMRLSWCTGDAWWM